MKTILAVLLVLAVGCSMLLAQYSYDDGIRALAIRDTTAAVAAFQKAVHERRKVSESAYYLGSIAYARGRVEEATAQLTASLADDGDNVNALQLYGDILVKQNRLRDALVKYRKGAKLAPASIELGIALGKSLLAADSLDAAIVQFSITKLHAPKNPVIVEGLGDAYAKLGVDIMAIGHYQEAIKLVPKNIAVHMKLAHLMLDGRRYNDAVKVLKTIHQIDSSYAPAYLDEAEVYSRAKMFKHAIGPLKTYRRLQPKSVGVDSMYLRALVDAGQHAAASKTLAEILRRDSSSVENWRMYAHALVEIKDYRAAVNAFGGMQRRNAMTAIDERLLGKTSLQLGNEAEALAAYERAIQGDSLNCEPYYDLGYLYMKKHDYASAASMFEKKILCDSTSAGSYLNAGACYMALAGTSPDRSNLLMRARILLTRAKEQNLDNLTIRFRLAQYYVIVDSLERAKEEYQEVVKKAATQPDRYRKEAGEAHSQIAMYYASTNQPERAITSFANASSAGYENASMQMNWGLAILQATPATADENEARKRAADAVSRFRRAVRLDPQSAPAHFWLGEGLIRLRVPGDNQSVHKYTEEACSEFKKALAIDPRHEGALKEIRLRGCK
jgi:tetratricopeptide (TPR) repeat protein